MHCFGWLQKPVNTAASHRSTSFGRLSPAREKHDRWPYSQAKLQQQFLTQKVLVHLRLQSTISSPVNGRKIVPSKPYLNQVYHAWMRTLNYCNLPEKNSQKFQKIKTCNFWLPDSAGSLGRLRFLRSLCQRVTPVFCRTDSEIFGIFGFRTSKKILALQGYKFNVRDSDKLASTVHCRL